MPRLLSVILCLAFWALPAAAAETRSDMAFDVQIRGFNAGVLRMSTVRNAGSYAASARFDTAGIVGLFRPLRFDAGVEGRIRGATLAPLRYREDVQTHRREGRREIAFDGGVPRVVLEEPAREAAPWHLDPATQRGTIDPMTALVRVMAATAAGAACRLDLTMFDGRRRSQLVLGAPQAEGEGLACAGELRRIAGYSDSEMAEARSFPFRVVYAPDADGLLQVLQVEARTNYGMARLVRR